MVSKVASGEWQGSYCLSEPQAGSDVQGITTRAVRDGDHYVLNGRKAWITNAGISDFYTVFAKTDPEASRRTGISAFVVERDTPGFSVGKLESKMGVRGSPTGEMLLDDVVVPVERLIGDEGAGLGTPSPRSTARGRSSAPRRSASRRAPRGRGALRQRAAPVRVRDRTTSRACSSCSPTWRPSVEASRLLVYRACSLVDGADPRLTKTASMAKLFATDTAMSVTTDAVQLLGGAGYTRDFPVERMMRDAKVTQIYEGTNQIQRIVIARHLLDEVAADLT